jgi:hypothetical protein
VSVGRRWWSFVFVALLVLVPLIHVLARGAGNRKPPVKGG